MLLIDVKSAFDHISRICLLQTMKRINTDGDLIRWTESFMSDRSRSLVNDSHLCEKRAVELEVAQRSLVSPVHLTIYLSGVFREVEQEVGGCMTTLFVDD